MTRYSNGKPGGFLGKIAGTLFGLFVLISVFTPLFYSFNDVVRETPGTFILCRYLRVTPAWLVGLLTFLAFLAGLWCIYVFYAGQIAVIPVLFMILLPLSYMILAETMTKGEFRFHFWAIMLLVFTQTGLILTLAPTRWPVLVFMFLAMLVGGITQQFRGDKTNTLVESIYSLSAWFIAITLPFAFILVDLQQPVLNYYQVINHAATPLLVVLVIFILILPINILFKNDDDDVDPMG
nr:hypothetical protein [Sicyoidochytrium minutum DNA virus]